MNIQESSPQPVPHWGGHFKLVNVGDIEPIFDANGTLYYDPGSQRLRLYDENGQIRLTVQIHRVHQPKSDRFPKGNLYNIRLTHQTKDGSPVECELHFRSPDEAVRLNLHDFILAERGIEHPGALRKKHPLGNAMPAEQAPAAKVPRAEPPRASTPSDDEGLVEQLRQKDADLEAEKAARKQAEEEISRLKQENAKKDQAIVDITMELLELKRSK